jgi:TetR/AcrR family transcriptional repressor of nem operon
MAKTSAREKVIEASIQLMTGRGYAATTVDDIVKQAGVAKGSVYHSFKSKEEMVIASLEYYLAQGLEILAKGPFQEIDEPVDKALAFVQHVEDKSTQLWTHGCLLGSLAIEVAESYPALITEIDKLFKRLERIIASIFAPALEARGVTEVTAQGLSVYLLAVIEGSIIAARSHSDPQYLQDGIGHFRRYLALLLA